MVLSTILIGIASLITFVLGALPPPGSSPFFIQNPTTGFVIDDSGGGGNSGNLIIGFPVNSVPTTNQQWNLQLLRIIDSSGFYLFTCVSPGIQIYVNGLPANGFNAQVFGSPLNVTEFRPGIFSITFPFTNLALTTVTTSTQQLTLQPFNSINPLQQWIFSPVRGGVSSSFPGTTGPSSTFFPTTTSFPFTTGTGPSFSTSAPTPRPTTTFPFSRAAFKRE